MYAKGVIAQHNLDASRYTQVGFMSDIELAGYASKATLALYRASSSVFELAAWGLPAVLVPLPDSAGDHQRANAYSFASRDAAVVIEEQNLKGSVLVNELRRYIEQTDRYSQTKTALAEIAKTNAASEVALELLELGVFHK